MTVTVTLTLGPDRPDVPDYCDTCRGEDCDACPWGVLPPAREPGPAAIADASCCDGCLGLHCEDCPLNPCPPAYR